jgi:hypothetical protein
MMERERIMKETIIIPMVVEVVVARAIIAQEYGEEQKRPRRSRRKTQ